MNLIHNRCFFSVSGVLSPGSPSSSLLLSNAVHRSSRAVKEVRSIQSPPTIPVSFLCIAGAAASCNAFRYRLYSFLTHKNITGTTVVVPVMFFYTCFFLAQGGAGKDRCYHLHRFLLFRTGSADGLLHLRSSHSASQSKEGSHDPAHTHVVEGQHTEQITHKAQRDPQLVQGVNNAYNTHNAHSAGICIRIVLQPLVCKTHYDQNNRHRIDRIQNRHRDAEDGIQALIAHCEREECNANNQLTIGNFLNQSREILRDRSDQTNTSRQASQSKIPASNTAPGPPNNC